MRTGRPTSLTPAVQAIVVEAIGRGLYRETAAQLAGVRRQTLWNWEQRGEAGEAPFSDFFDAIKKAEAQAESDVIDGVRAGLDGWQSKAWIAERRWPSRWSGRVRVTVNDHVDALTAKLRSDPELHRKVSDVLADQEPPAQGAGAH